LDFHLFFNEKMPAATPFPILQPMFLLYNPPVIASSDGLFETTKQRTKSDWTMNMRSVIVQWFTPVCRENALIANVMVHAR